MNLLQGSMSHDCHMTVTWPCTVVTHWVVFTVALLNWFHKENNVFEERNAESDPATMTVMDTTMKSPHPGGPTHSSHPPSYHTLNCMTHSMQHVHHTLHTHFSVLTTHPTPTHSPHTQSPHTQHNPHTLNTIPTHSTQSPHTHNTPNPHTLTHPLLQQSTLQ